MEVEIKSTKFVLTSNSGALPGVADPSGDDPNPDPTLEKKKQIQIQPLWKTILCILALRKKELYFGGGGEATYTKYFSGGFRGKRVFNANPETFRIYN